VGGGANRPGNIGSGNRNNIAGGDRNIANIDRGNIGNINIDADNGWWPGYGYGYGAAAVAGAAIATAAIGSAVYTLPPSCISSPYSGYTYYDCAGVWYQPQFEGESVTYIVVEDPHK
jgi:hypothetical protein